MKGPIPKILRPLYHSRMFPSITLPTHSSGTLIDQIYCKLKDPKQLVFSCVIDTMISDHYPCFAVVDILKSRKHKPKFVQVYKHDPAAFLSFYDILSARFQDVPLDPDLFADPNDNYALFESIVVDTKSKYLAQKTVRFKSINTGFPHGSRMVFCIPSNIEINCFGKYDPFQTERTSIYHYL